MLRTIPDRIRKVIQHHIFTLTCLGARHGGTGSKIHAACHGMRTECYDWGDVQGLLNLYFSMAIDSRPEKGFCRMHFVPNDIFPHWTEVEDGDPGLDDPDHLPDGQAPLTMSETLEIPGTFHSTNNLNKRLLGQIDLWDEYEAATNSAAHYMHHRHCRDTFTETCLTGDRLLWNTLFAKGPPLNEGGRVWGVVIKIAMFFTE